MIGLFRYPRLNSWLAGLLVVATLMLSVQSLSAEDEPRVAGTAATGTAATGNAKVETPAAKTAAQGTIDFRRDIYPILSEHCFDCHQGSDADSGVRLDLHDKLLGRLDSTPVVWGGEFGRTPGAEKKGGRDHSPGGFTMWLAGGGVRGGQVIGETDPVGYTAIDRPITPNALHATILHGLGIDQLKLTFPLNGRDEIPTFLPAEVVTDAFA